MLPRRMEAYLLCLVLAVLLVLPLAIQDDYLLHIMIRSMIYALVVMGLTLFIGYTGQVSIGHSAFYGGAGYIAGLMAIAGYGLLASWLTAVAVIGLAGLLIGLVVLHTKGNYLALASIAIAIMVVTLVKNIDVTGGPTGLTGIPKISLLGYKIASEVQFYYLALTSLCTGFIVLRRLIDSRFGDAMLAIANNDLAAQALGINIYHYKILSFSISAVYAAAAGVLAAYYDGYVSPEHVSLDLSILFFVMAYIGGIRSLYGAILGAFVLTFLSEFAQDFGNYNTLMYGVLLALIVRFMPTGIYDAPRVAYRNLKRWL